MKMQFRVRYDNGQEHLVTAKDADIVAFERQFDLPFSVMVPETEGVELDCPHCAQHIDTKVPKQQQHMRMEWLHFLAWAAAHRTGVEQRGFDEFLKDLDEAEMVGDSAKSDPTPTAATEDASAS